MKEVMHTQHREHRGVASYEEVVERVTAASLLIELNGSGRAQGGVRPLATLSRVPASTGPFNPLRRAG